MSNGESFEFAVRDVNRRAGYNFVSNTGKIPKLSSSPPEQLNPETANSDDIMHKCRAYNEARSKPA